MLFKPRNSIPFWIGIVFFVLGVSILLYSELFYKEPEESISGNEVLVKVYFSNKKEDPDVLQCEKTYHTYRLAELSNKIKIDAIVKTSPSEELARKVFYALNGLLMGPTAQEIEQGFYSSINPNTKINEIIIDDGVAKADFSKELNEGAAGACLVSAIRSQIENTLRQFPEIKETVISVNGDSKNILQP